MMEIRSEIIEEENNNSNSSLSPSLRVLKICTFKNMMSHGEHQYESKIFFFPHLEISMSILEAFFGIL